jgi:ABC-type transporter Mla subunit MlaD
MLTTIKQLEQEIEEFHKTVASSNELIRLLKSLAVAVSDQADESLALEEAIAHVPDTIRSDYETLFMRFSDEGKNHIEVLGRTQDEALSKLSDNLSNMQTKHGEMLEQNKNDFRKEMNSYCAQLTQLQGVISHVPDTIRSDHKTLFMQFSDEGKNHIEVLGKTQEEALSKLSDNLSNMQTKHGEMLEQSKNDFKKEMDSYCAQLTQLQGVITHVPDAIRSDHKTLFMQFFDEGKNHIEVLGKTQEEVLSKLSDNLSNMHVKHSEMLEQSKNDFKKEMGSYCAQLTQLQQESKSIEENINKKYAVFLSKLESPNISEVYKLCLGIRNRQDNLEKHVSEVQKTLESKFENLNSELKKDRKILQSLIVIGVVIIIGVLVIFATR